jgi:hypothetical protein
VSACRQAILVCGTSVIPTAAKSRQVAQTLDRWGSGRNRQEPLPVIAASKPDNGHYVRPLHFA